jgi:hypothetical protein
MATILSIDPDTIIGEEPLGQGTYEVLVNVAIKGMLHCRISMLIYDILVLLSQGSLHGQQGNEHAYAFYSHPLYCCVCYADL